MGPRSALPGRAPLLTLRALGSVHVAPPQLLASVPFVGSTQKASRGLPGLGRAGSPAGPCSGQTVPVHFAGGVLRPGSGAAAAATHYALELGGPVLPAALWRLSNLLVDTQDGAFDLQCANVASTIAFNRGGVPGAAGQHMAAAAEEDDEDDNGGAAYEALPRFLARAPLLHRPGAVARIKRDPRRAGFHVTTRTT